MKKIILITLLAATTVSSAQISRLGNDIQYQASLEGTAGNGDVAPFWFTNNRYGLGTTEVNSGLLRASIVRNAEADSLRKWRIGYGADLVGALNHDSYFVLQQLFADFQYRAVRLSVGQKERPMELKNQRLSSGSMTLGINARPVPQVRLELPDFWAIPGTKHWLALKAHIAYGMYTDNRWQRHFTEGTTNPYTANSFFHSKAGFLRIGNSDRFPLTLTGGLEMACQFGGEGWNLPPRLDDPNIANFDPHQKMTNGIKSFWNAFIPSGNDVNDGEYKNVEGNQVGSWHLRLDYHGKGWGVGVYAEHFFEDHSQMFWQYPWKDMLYGVEARLPKNPVLSTLVYEHLRTTDQSGPIYHDGTSTFPDNIYGTDIQVKMFDDRLVVESPGKLPGLVRPENIRHTHFSRNPLIAQYLKTYTYVREFGEGVDRMCREMEAQGLRPVKYSQQDFMTLATAYNQSEKKSESAEMGQKPLIESPSSSFSGFESATFLPEEGQSPSKITGSQSAEIERNPMIQELNSGFSYTINTSYDAESTDSTNSEVLRLPISQMIDTENIKQRLTLMKSKKPTITKIMNLCDTIKVNEVFGSRLVSQILYCSGTQARAIINILKELELIEPVAKQGKGKYIFVVNK